MRRKGKIVQTCCGGIPVRNGRCSICGDSFSEEESSIKVPRLSRTRKRAKFFNEPVTFARV